MPLSPAERQRAYRLRLKQDNPQKYDEMQKRNRERIKSKYVKISLLPKNQQDMRRKTWRKLKKNLSSNVSTNDNKKEPRSRKKYYQKYNKLRKIIEKQKNKIERMKVRVATLEKKVYRKNLLLKCQQLPNDDDQLDVKENIDPLTPNSKSDLFVQTLNSVSSEDKKKVKRVLLENNILSTALADQYSDCRSNTERNVIKNLCNRDLVCKYKMRTQIGHYLGLKGRVRVTKKGDKGLYFNKKQKDIESFFLQDDVSRASAGKKETKTQKKVKVQKRYLLNNLVNLYKKFRVETGSKISYTTFIRHKPFYIVTPQLTDRNTCVCKIHSNIDFKFTALKRLSVLNVYKELGDIVKDTVCSIDLKECMFNECPTCSNESVKFNFTEHNEQETVTWLEWVVKKIEYQKNNEVKSSKRVKKDMKNSNLANLIEKFEEELKVYKIHIFNMRHQYNCYKNLKDNLQSNEVVLHCDFSENYTCKMHEAIQSVHFGASQYQITLHTSVVYKKNTKPQSYCTFSDSTNHSPEAIWAHLIPVLSDINQTTPEIDILHVYSDGPSTQYKQKKNFFLLSKISQELGFRATWNFSESYHGKGAADGVGGTIKRLLDKKVSYGSDVLNANSALEILKSETTIKLFCIDEKNIDFIKKSNEFALNHLTAIPKTMKIHQIQTTNKPGEVFYRILSCYCDSSDTKGFCNCFELQKYCLLNPYKRNSLQNNLLPRSDTPTSTASVNKFVLIRKRKLIISSSEDDDETYQDNYSKKAKTIASNNLFPATEHFCPVISGQLEQEDVSTGLISSSTTTGYNEVSKQDLSSDDEEIFSTLSKKPFTSSLIMKQDLASISKMQISATTSISDNALAGSCTESKLSPSAKANDVKATTSKISVLSNVKVDYSSKDRLKMLSSIARYNISSSDLKKDFNELYTSTTNLPMKKNLEVEREILSTLNTDGSIVVQKVSQEKPHKDFFFNFTSSDEEYEN